MFSEKYGYKPEKTIQHECISDELRCRVWNLFSQQEIKAGGLASKRLSQAMNGEPTIEEKIVDRMGFLIDPTTKDLSAEAQLKNKILRFFSWFEVYSKLSGSSSALEMPITIVNTPASLSVLDEASTSLDIGLLIQMEILSTVTSFVATLAASSVEEVVS